ncbi:MAG: hypothetical protein AAF990_19475 [Bacteroidota bacterium]
MKNIMMLQKQLGIWLDRRKAFLIDKDNIDNPTVCIHSDIEEVRPVGGARSKSAWGPMDVISETKHLERRRHQERKYFQKIFQHIKDVDELYIFGPAEAKVAFLGYLKSLKSLSPIVRKAETADTMTINQMVAKVKRVFESGCPYPAHKY